MSRKYPRTPAAYTNAVPDAASLAALTHAPDTEDDTMAAKIQFTSVTLHKEVPRLDAGKGRATHSTTFFDERAGVGIEYDPATCLVRISKGPAAVYVPREGVERFGPTVADAKAEADARAAMLAEQAAANAKAAAEAEASAQQPA